MMTRNTAKFFEFSIAIPMKIVILCQERDLFKTTAGAQWRCAQIRCPWRKDYI